MTWTEPAVLAVLIGGGVTVVTTLVLAVITGWYAHSTARMLREMKRQSRLLAISVAAGVESGIMQTPPPGQASTLHKETLGRLAELQEQVERLLREIDT
jgi:hypothetical protein